MLFPLTLFIPLFSYLPSTSLPGSSAVTAYLCEPMIYHLLILADYRAFHTALICCWARFSLHSCQLSFGQAANRLVSVSQLHSHHQGLYVQKKYSTQGPMGAILISLKSACLKRYTERSSSRLCFVNVLSEGLKRVRGRVGRNGEFLKPKIREFTVRSWIYCKSQTSSWY